MTNNLEPERGDKTPSPAWYRRIETWGLKGGGVIYPVGGCWRGDWTLCVNDEGGGFMVNSVWCNRSEAVAACQNKDVCGNIIVQ